VLLGVATDSDDADGIETAWADAEALAAVTDERIAAGIAALTGEIDQVPSTVSAIKVAGRRAYDLARAGESVELAARRVTVDRFDIVRRRDTAEGASNSTSSSIAPAARTSAPWRAISAPLWESAAT
jgi:tRNA pseudouridine55 synthase